MDPDVFVTLDRELEWLGRYSAAFAIFISVSILTMASHAIVNMCAVTLHDLVETNTKAKYRLKYWSPDADRLRRFIYAFNSGKRAMYLITVVFGVIVYSYWQISDAEMSIVEFVSKMENQNEILSMVAGVLKFLTPKTFTYISIIYSAFIVYYTMSICRRFWIIRREYVEYEGGGSM